MSKKVTLSVQVSLATRKNLKKMAIELDITMAELIEELIAIRYKEEETDGITRSFYSKK